MTLHGWCRKHWRKRYGTPPGQQQKGAFHHEYPKHVKLVVIDFMQFVKHVKVEHQTLRDILNEWLRLIRDLYRESVECVVLCFDRGTPQVKSLICHGKRYEKVDRFTDADSPVLTCNLDTPLVQTKLGTSPWMRFAGNQKLLQRELYPLLWNLLINPNTFPLRPGQMLVLHGLPSRLQPVTVYQGALWENAYAHRDQSFKPIPWSLDGHFGNWPLTAEYEANDPELYSRVFKVVGIPGGTFVEREPRYENSILEADNAVFWYQHFPEFRDLPTMIHINDGDAVSIALLQSHDRVNEKSQFYNEQYICLKYVESAKDKKEREKLPGQRGKPPPHWEYCDVNKLHTMLDHDPVLLKSGVSNPQLAFVMLNILPGSDFFDKKYRKGIGPQFIWDTFFTCANQFSHLVQWHIHGLPRDPLAYRRCIVDETLFEQFTYYIYVNKHGKAVRKKTGGNLDLVQLRAHKRLPSERQCKQFARQLGWHLQYWLNAARNIYVDPFERYENMSYWTYQKNPYTQEPEVTLVFSPKQKPMDEAYKRNLLKRKRKEKPQQDQGIAQEQKKRAVEAVNEYKS